MGEADDARCGVDGEAAATSLAGVWPGSRG